MRVRLLMHAAPLSGKISLSGRGGIKQSAFSDQLSAISLLAACDGLLFVRTKPISRKWLVLNGGEGIFEPPIQADGFEAGFAVARLRQVEIGIRFELLLKTKDRIGFVTQSCFWFVPGGPSGRARIGCSDLDRKSTRLNSRHLVI